MNQASLEPKKRSVIVAGAPSLDWMVQTTATPVASETFVPVPGTTMLVAELLRKTGHSVVLSTTPGNRTVDRPDVPGRLFSCLEHAGKLRLGKCLADLRGVGSPRFVPPSFENAGVCVIDLRDSPYWALPEAIDWLRQAKQFLKTSGTVDCIVIAGTAFFSGRVSTDIFDLFIHCGEKISVVCDIDDIRAGDILISRNLSWERTAIDLVQAFEKNPHLHLLRYARRITVSISFDGALVVEGDGQCAGYTLVYDPLGIEGLFRSSLPGGMPGRIEIIASRIARAFVNGENPGADAITQSLSAVRATIQSGIAPFPPSFPFDQAMTDGLKNPFACVSVPRNPPMDWTILGELDRRLDRQGLDVLAESIVKFGVEMAIFSHQVVIPVGKVGGVMSVDRAESENLRAIYNIIDTYVRESDAVRPLSIAVFGAPGSGKSFGVKQIITAIVGKDAKGKTRSAFIELNVSQITSVNALVAAFHQVRDANLKGRLPVLFFDEFDSAVDGAPLYWLKNFLAPMQDGEFREGEAVHPTGRAIFVFAGGTSHSFESFTRQGEPVAGASAEADARRLAFIQAKGPDFVSRLRGFINVLGPNRVSGRMGLPSRAGEDPLHIIRRAVFIHSILKSDAAGIVSPEGLRIDPGIVRAMLLAPRFKHGVRSISAFVQMCRLAEATRFERSHLPDPAQLELHVDAREFLAMCNEDCSEAYTEAWARALHENYRREQERAGWKYGEKKDPSRKTNPLLVDYEKLEAFFRDSNRDCARSIPAKLKMLGYTFRKTMGAPPSFEFPPEVIRDHLDRISEFEHDRWYRFYVLDGWKWAPKRNDEKKEHNLLVPYRELPEDEKFKDAATITVIPKVLGETGFEVYPIA